MDENENDHEDRHRAKDLYRKAHKIEGRKHDVIQEKDRDDSRKYGIQFSHKVAFFLLHYTSLLSYLTYIV